MFGVWGVLLGGEGREGVGEGGGGVEGVEHIDVGGVLRRRKAGV